MDDMARKNSRPMLRSVTPMVSVMGITATDMSPVTTMTAGASVNTVRSANGGTQSSLVKILIMSASTMPRPNGPTRLGP